MLVDNDVYINRYVADGSTASFPIAFPFLEASHIEVYTRGEDGEDILVDPSMYTITGAGIEEGGELTFNTAPVAGTVIAIVRNVPITQLYAYTELDNFPAESHENALAKLTMIDQQQAEILSRAVLVPVTSDKTPEDYLAELQHLMDEAKRLLGILEMAYLANGLTCVERTWTLPTDTPAGTLITLPDNLWYIVGRYHVRLSYDGIVLDHTRWLEVGEPNTISTDIICKCSFPAGTEINVWISHLAADEGESDSQQNQEIAALQTAVGVLNDSMAELSRNVVYRTVADEEE